MSHNAMRSFYDTNEELGVIPYRNGVRLVQPIRTSRQSSDELTTIGKLLAAPCNAYFLNTESRLVNGNITNAKVMGYDSIKASIGKSLDDVYAREMAEPIHANDRQILSEQKANFFEEMIVYDNEVNKNCLSIKMPLYDGEKVNGIFGFSIVFGEQQLDKSLAIIAEAGLLHVMHPYTSIIKHFSAYQCEEIPQLTARELQILDLVVRGKICPEISLRLGLSKRTVEHYIANVKEKFNVQTKSELIEKALLIKKNYHLSL